MYGDEEAHLTENAQFDIEYVNDVILLKPINVDMKKDDVLSYAGIFAGAWGDTSDEVETTIRNLHNEWEK